MDKCKVCGRTMVVSPAPEPGDPGFVCPVDDAAHRAAAEAWRVEAERILADSRKAPEVTPEQLVEIGSRSRVRT